MNKLLKLMFLLLFLCGSAVSRPAQAYFTTRAKLITVLQTDDWQPATTKLTLNNQEIIEHGEQLRVGWVDCSTLQSQVIDTLESTQCVQRHFAFSASQQRSVSLLYQLSAQETVATIDDPKVRIKWNNSEIAWLSNTNSSAQWLTVFIPNSQLEGLLSIEMVGDQSTVNQTQLEIQQIASSRILLGLGDNLTISSNDPGATTYISLNQFEEPMATQSQMNIGIDLLADEGSLLYWSVDAWGNTENPKTIMYQVISHQAPKPKVIWHYVQNNRLYMVVKTERIQPVGFISGYQLIAETEIMATLEQPWITSTMAIHLSGSLVGLSFPLMNGIHTARLLSLDQLGGASLSSDLITF